MWESSTLHHSQCRTCKNLVRNASLNLRMCKTFCAAGQCLKPQIALEMKLQSAHMHQVRLAILAWFWHLTCPLLRMVWLTRISEWYLAQWHFQSNEILLNILNMFSDFAALQNPETKRTTTSGKKEDGRKLASPKQTLLAAMLKTYTCTVVDQHFRLVFCISDIFERCDLAEHHTFQTICFFDEDPRHISWFYDMAGRRQFFLLVKVSINTLQTMALRKSTRTMPWSRNHEKSTIWLRKPEGAK